MGQGGLPAFGQGSREGKGGTQRNRDTPSRRRWSPFLSGRAACVLACCARGVSAGGAAGSVHGPSESPRSLKPAHVMDAPTHSQHDAFERATPPPPRQRSAVEEEQEGLVVVAEEVMGKPRSSSKLGREAPPCACTQASSTTHTQCTRLSVTSPSSTHTRTHSRAPIHSSRPLSLASSCSLPQAEQAKHHSSTGLGAPS